MTDTDNKKWYVLKVRPRYEKAIAERLSHKYEIFLPLIKRESQWSDRIKIIESPLFSGYMFIKTDIKMMHFILEENGVSAFVQFGATPAVIRDREIDAIRLLAKNNDTLKVDEGYAFSKGEEVLVKKGVFAGIRGRVNMIKNRSRLFVLIEQLGKIISVEVDMDSLEKVI